MIWRKFLRRIYVFLKKMASQLTWSSVTLYTNLGNDGVVHGVNQVSGKVLITSHALLPKVLNLKDNLPTIKTIIVFEDFTQDKRVIYLKQSNITVVPFKHIETKGAKLGNWISITRIFISFSVHSLFQSRVSKFLFSFVLLLFMFTISNWESTNHRLLNHKEGPHFPTH